ncbi:MAG: efflux RND transporter periplasmic adaptor subunit [Burkholderiaceae bacterium]|nr:efflux RND transporter periplasmic adaptor subunit [Burkholderiaceae bacterium]
MKANSTTYGRTLALAIFSLAASSGTSYANPYGCLIEPNKMVEVRSPVEGIIEAVMVKRGDQVRAGQVLAQLDSSVENAAAELGRYRSKVSGRIAVAKSRLDYATKKLQRLEQLQAQNYVTAQMRDEAAAEKRIAEDELREAGEGLEIAGYEYRHAQTVLKRRTLRSPFDGVVVDRMLNPGDLAEAGTGRKAILKLAQVEPLRVETVLPVEAFGKLKKSSKAEVIPEGLGGRYAATVVVIDSVFDSASGTFGVRLQLPNPKGKLPAGIRCRVDFPALRDLTAKGPTVK